MGLIPSAATAQGTIYGQVTDEQNNPLAGLAVAVYLADANGFSRAEVTYTADDGSYDFGSVLALRQYKIRFGELTWSFPEAEFYDNVATLDEAQVIMLTPDSPTAILNAKLPTALIRGTVTNEAGQPLINASISVTGYSADVSLQSARFVEIDSTGAYTLAGLAAGAYRVQFQADSYRPIYYDRAPTWSIAKLIEVRQGATVDQINARLIHYTGSLQGRITNEQGRQLAGVRVSVYEDFDDDDQWEVFVERDTDAAGEYQIVDLPDGAYRLQFSHSIPRLGRYACGDYYYVEEYYPNVATLAAAQSLIIKNGGKLANLNAQLIELNHIRGRVMGPNHEPVAGILVRAMSQLEKGGTACFDVPTDQAGYYDLGVPDGVHSLGFFTYLHQGIGPMWFLAPYALEYYHDQNSFAAALPITARKHAIVTGIDAWLDPGGAFVGTVTDRNNVGLAQIKVTAYSDPDDDKMWEPVSSDLSDASGAYIVPALPSGLYHLEFRDTRQPPIFHTKTYNLGDPNNIVVYPEHGSALIIDFVGDDRTQTIFPIPVQLIGFNELNSPPLARNDRMFVFSTSITNTFVSHSSVLDNDRDGEEESLTATLLTLPSHGNLSLAASGFFTYTPLVRTPITDTFTYWAKDSLHQSNVATVVINPIIRQSFMPFVKR